MFFFSEWLEFLSATFLAEKNDDISLFYDVEIAHVTWHASFQPL